MFEYRFVSAVGVLLAVLGVLAPGSALADRALTIDEALSIARTQNRDLGAARATLDRSEANVDLAFAGLMPIISAQGRYTLNYKEVTLDFAAQNAPLLALSGALRQAFPGQEVQTALMNFENQLNAAASGEPVVIQDRHQLDASINATVPVLAPSVWASLSAAKRAREAADANYDATLAQVLLRVAQSFYASAGAEELSRVRKHGIEVAKETLENAKARFSTGVVNRVEVTRAEIALLQAEQAAVEAEDVVQQAHRALATILALDEPFHVVSDAGNTSKPKPPRETLDAARTRRPELAALERTIAANEARSSAALWRWAPVLSLFANARAFNYAGFSGDNYAWAAGAQLDWTIWDGGARDADRHAAEADQRETEARLAQLSDTVTDEVANAERAVDTRRRALETAKKSVELSAETLELVRAQHEAGTATQIDLLTAQDQLIGAEVAVAQARFNLSLAELELEKAAGIFPAAKE